MTTRDKGVHPDLLRRHFGEQGADLTPLQKRLIAERERRKAAGKLAKMRRELPKKPPGN
jgi:hypothetical protein